MPRCEDSAAFFVTIQHTGKMIKIRAGELAHRNVFDHFSRADKARSASESPTVPNAEYLGL